MYSDRRDPSTPNDILLARLVLQAITFLVSIVLLELFIWRARNAAFTTISRTFMPPLRLWCYPSISVFAWAGRDGGRVRKNMQSYEAYLGTLEFMLTGIIVRKLVVCYEE